MYLLSRYSGWSAQQELWGYVADQILVLHFNGEDEQARMQVLMEQYRDLPMDLADASLVAAAETLNQKRFLPLIGIFRFIVLKETNLLMLCLER